MAIHGGSYCCVSILRPLTWGNALQQQIGSRVGMGACMLDSFHCCCPRQRVRYRRVSASNPDFVSPGGNAFGFNAVSTYLSMYLTIHARICCDVPRLAGGLSVAVSCSSGNSHSWAIPLDCTCTYAASFYNIVLVQL